MVLAQRAPHAFPGNISLSEPQFNISKDIWGRNRYSKLAHASFIVLTPSRNSVAGTTVLLFSGNLDARGRGTATS
jgi:hypothetical protein